jgi:hypothetical protein
MTSPKALATCVFALLLSACGPAGKITGKVVVEGGSAGKILVRILGPSSMGVLTDDSGNFTAEKVADGNYQVIAEVVGTDVTEQRDTVTVTNGTADKSPTLTFKASVGKIAGKVVFTDMSDSSGITVTLSGTEARGVQTAAGGTYEFTGLKPGAYMVTAEVPGTLEGRQSVSVLAAGTANPLPDLVFTWLGRLTGNVKAGTTNAPNAAVNIPGTDRFAITDSGGNFVLDGVPTGMVTVMVRLNSATASQNVTVMKGDNTPLAFTLQTALTGTVEGSVGFHSSILDSSITVSAAGTTYTTTAAANGDYKLTLPPGVYEIVADARNYPRNSLGVHRVDPGVVTRIPTAKISLYRRLPFDVGITSVNFSYPRTTCEGDYVLALMGFSAGSAGLYLIDTNLLNRRLIVSPASASNQAVLSSKCKWVAFTFGGYTVLHNVTTGEQRYIFQGTPSYLDFTTDETVLFYVVGTTLHRYTIASGNDDVFTANSFISVSRDRLLISGGAAPWNYQLVQATGSPTTAFSNAASAATFGNAAWALTDCVTTITTVCTLKVLGTSGSTVSSYSTAQVASGTSLDVNNSTGEYYHFRNVSLVAGASILVRTSSGSGINMPNATAWIRYNPAGTRFAYAAPASAQSLREEPLPGTGTVVPAATTTTTFSTNTNYLSDTRIIVFDNNGPRRIDIKSGTATIDTDLTTSANGPFFVSNTVATWGKLSTSKRIAVLGDGSDQVIDAPPLNVYNADSVMPFTIAAPTTWTAPKYGIVSTDPNQSFVIDAVKNELRKLNGFFVNGGFYGNIFVAVRPATSETEFFIPGFDQHMNLIEPGVSPAVLDLQPTVAVTLLSRDTQEPKQLLIFRLGQQP